MTLADLVRKLAKLTDEDVIKWQSRPGGYCTSKGNFSVTVIRQSNEETGQIERTDIIFVSGNDDTKTPTSFNLCDYDYRTIVEAVIRSNNRDKNKVEIGLLRHAEQVVEGLK